MFKFAQLKVVDPLANLFTQVSDFLAILLVQCPNSQTQDPRGVRDLVRDLNHHFLQPMSSVEKALATGIIIFIIILALLLTYKAIKSIWSGDDSSKGKKLL